MSYPNSSKSDISSEVLSMNTTNKTDTNVLTRKIAFINTNARSLAPKMESLADCMYEIEASIAIVTETWLQDRDEGNTVVDLAGEHGLDVYALNRQDAASNGRQYGGVAVFSRAASTSFKPFDMPNPEKFEVLCVTGRVSKLREKVAIIAVYIPPGYTKVDADCCVEYVSDMIAEVKRKLDSPIIVVGGDWNQWNLQPILNDHADLAEVDHGPTRGNRKIDRFLTNFSRSITESDVLPPLDDGLGRVSDHKIAYFRASFDSNIDKKVSYKYRHFTEAGATGFQNWIAGHDFEAVYSNHDVNEQLSVFLAILDKQMNVFFPYKTTTRRERDPPWINPYVRQLIKRRRKVYHREGRSKKWKELMKKVRKLVKNRAKNYWDHQKKDLLKNDASRVFFKNVKAYSSRERPAQFDVRSILPGRSDEEVAECLADHFNGISCEFDGLDPTDVPVTFSSPLQMLSTEDVRKRLTQFKKPKSMVKHDIFPALVNNAAQYLAGPLTHIFNTISATSVWPLRWKEEFVTPIPKKSVPQNLNDLRNISCTALFSKVYESFVLGWLSEQVGMRANQLGGMRGAGTEHYLVELYQLVLEALEDPRAASVITSIDYAKAFNRLDFLHCLRALAAKGASSELIRTVASFLTSRTMSVKVGQVLSKPRVVLGGVPQGSILGVFLFNVTIDSFEAGSREVTQYDVIGGGEGAEPDPYEPHDRRLDEPTQQVYDRPGFKAWQSALLAVLKYVDDNVIHEKLFMDGAVIDEEGRKRVCAVRSGNLFRQITLIAESLGMRVNSSKTMVLTVSDSRTYKAAAFIKDLQGNEIDCVEKLKILGVHFSSRPDMADQVDAICKKFRARIWILRHLHHNGFVEEDLLKVYKSVILPCHDYCSNVFHSSLTLSQTVILERLQAKALKAIYGYEPSYRVLMEKSGLTTLRARRENREIVFARKCATSPRFARWFPEAVNARETRSENQYREFFARCVRCYNSPLYSMRRRLNRDVARGGAREGGAV